MAFSWQQFLALAATCGLFTAICIVLRSHGIRVVASSCLFVASLTTVQLAVGWLSKPPYSWHHPGFLVTLHFATVWVACAGYWVWSGEPRKIFPCSIGARRWTLNILPYALCMPISVVLNNVGIMDAGPGLVAIIGTLSPIVTSIVSRFFGRHIPRLSWMGVAIAMVGGTIISQAEFDQVQQTGKGKVLRGMLCALLSVFGRAFKIVISDWLLSPTAYAKKDGKPHEEHLSFMHIYVLQFSMGVLATLLFAFYMDRADGALKAWESLDSGVIAMIIITCIPAFILNFMGGVVLSHLGATLQQLIGKLNTLVIAAISMAFMGEHLSHKTLIGTGFVLAGVAVFEKGMSKKETDNGNSHSVRLTTEPDVARDSEEEEGSPIMG